MPQYFSVSFFARNNKWEFVAVGLLIGILTLLGVLQYNWLGEISDAERERRQKTLSVSADNLTGEFDREITRLFVQLQINPNGKTLPENYHTRYERWQATTLYPQLVSKVFFAFKDESGSIRLVVYDAAAQRFQTSDWAPPLGEVRAAIERGLDAENIPAAGLSTKDKPIQGDLLLIPAVHVDLSNLNQTSAAGNNFASPRVRPIGYTVVLLDGEYLKKELLPSLTTRYFPNSREANDYRILIKERSNESVLYQSAAFAENVPDEDATVRDFFRVRLTEIGNLIPAASQNAESSVSVPSQNRISTGIVIASGGQTNASRLQIQEQGASLNGGFEPRWQLSAEYDGGSLDSIIGKTRWRNTLISGVILLLLGVSGAWLLILSNRSRVFARQQKDFVASVSHELRTPLAVIRSLSENLADGIVSGEKHTREYGALINNEEHRLSTMVEQMLGFAAAQNSSGWLERKAQNVTEIIEAALSDHRRELQNLDFVIEKSIAGDLPQVVGDFDTLRRAVGNLIGNAVKYSGEARVIKVRAQRSGDQKLVEISVEDSGTGISARDLPDIFKLFYRGQRAIDGQIKGSGIGLSLVKQIVEAHGGTVSVASELNRGSVFTIRLPH